jgi:hypothetical protein
MKGNQGLEALANLCNNASKSNEDANGSDRDNQQNQRSAPTSIPAVEFNSAINYAANTASQVNQNQSFNGLPHNIAALLKSMGPNINQQQAANVLPNTGLGVNTDSMSALHQLAYMNPLQSTQSSVLQLMNQATAATQNKYPYVGMDPSAVSAMFAATQVRQGGGKESSSHFIFHIS